MSWLTAELEKVQIRNAELKKTAAEEKQLRVDETQKLKESPENTKFRATSVQQELQALTEKTDKWLVELARINSEMTSKPPLLFCLYPTSKVCRIVAYPGVSHSFLMALPSLSACHR